VAKTKLVCHFTQQGRHSDSTRYVCGPEVRHSFLPASARYAAIASANAEAIAADLLIVGADEAGCAAAVQAARLGVQRIVLTNDIEWLGGQFCTQGIGPIDEWTRVNGKPTNFP
jgi:hypothetical protein